MVKGQFLYLQLSCWGKSDKRGVQRPPLFFVNVSGGTRTPDSMFSVPLRFSSPFRFVVWTIPSPYPEGLGASRLASTRSRVSSCFARDCHKSKTQGFPEFGRCHSQGFPYEAPFKDICSIQLSYRDNSVIIPCPLLICQQPNTQTLKLSLNRPISPHPWLVFPRTQGSP